MDIVFLKNYTEISLRTLERHFLARQIYNEDETVLSTVHKLAVESNHQVGLSQMKDVE